MPAPDYASEIASLERAVGTGELTIESDGDRVTYRSMADLLAALAYFRGQAATADPRAGAASTTFAAFSPE